MTDLVTRAQLRLLADGLGVEVARVQGLERLGADGLYALRMRISDRLFDEQAGTFSRVSMLAPMVPNSLVAKVAQAIVPPMVAGRAAGALGVDHPGRVSDLLARLSPGYMADCAPFLDPRTVAVIAPIVSGDVLVPAGRELLRRGDYVTAALFVEHATPEFIEAFVRGTEDDRGLLMTAACAPSSERLNEIIRLIPEERLRRIVLSAAGSTEALLAGLSLLSRLDADLTAELGAAFLESLSDDELDAVLNTAAEHDATDELLAVAAALPATTRLRVSSRPAIAGRLST